MVVYFVTAELALHLLPLPNEVLNALTIMVAKFYQLVNHSAMSQACSVPPSTPKCGIQCANYDGCKRALVDGCIFCDSGACSVPPSTPKCLA
jgi:hypothetical protein